MPEHVEGAVDCGCYGCIAEWEARSRARDSLVLLCKERVRVDLVELGGEPPVEYPLIEQLRQCCENSSGGQNVGRSRPGLPFDVVASEMLSSLEYEMRLDAVAAGAVEPGGAFDAVADGLALLEVLDGLSAEVVASRADVWARWVVQIRAHVHPERRTPVDGACPADGCGATKFCSYDEDGDVVRESALVAVWDGDRVDSLLCRVCLAWWGRAQLWEVANAMRPDLAEALAVRA